EVFSIGFGPKLLKWKWGETEYALSLIPLGGYVKMFGDDPLNKDEIEASERKFSFTHKGKWARFWIVMGGPLANFILAFVIFFFLLAGGEKVPEIKMGRLETTSQLYEKGLRSGDVVTKVNGHTVSSPSDIALESSDGIKSLTVTRGGTDFDLNVGMGAEEFFEEFSKFPPYFRKPILVNAKGEIKGVMLSDGQADLALSLDDLVNRRPTNLALFNVALIDDQHEVAEELGKQDIGQIENLEQLFAMGYRSLDLMVEKTADGSAASKAKIEAKDIIISLNGQSVFAFEDLRRSLQESEEKSARIQLWRNGETVEVELVPEVKEIEGKLTKLIGVY